MKIVFLSNFFNHHQAFLSEALLKKTNQQYYFSESMEVPEDRLRMGYGQQKAQYVLNSTLDPEKVLAYVDKADLVITGSAPEKLIRCRIRAGKLVFRYSERPLKRTGELWKYPYRFVKWHWRNPPEKAVYMLCASAYAAGDYAQFGLFRNKTYRWGYFPETKRYESIDGFMSKKNTTDILWCGRFLDWKHPDDAILAAAKLKKAGYSFRLHFIGRGEEEDRLQNLLKKYDLEDCIELLGAMPPEEVRTHMEQSGIYLFTSDKQEGWGAVLNESMNSGCAVIASHAIGSVPFLLKDGENGLIYRSGDVQMLYEKIKYLLDHPEEQKRLGKTAYETIVNEWNAEVAADRVINLAQAILDGEKHPDLYESGPCSRADRIKDNWF